MSKKHKGIWEVFKLILLSILVLIVLLLTIVFVSRWINAVNNKINTNNGIQENLYVEIGGINQYLQIRGQDKDNPVILFLHGGPGFPLTYLSPYYQKDLENEYTFVCWDQRGCGRTYYENSNNGDLSVDLLINDIDEIVSYIQSNINDDKVIIMGQSWGTLLGSTYIQEHPDRVKAYIGTGQIIDFDYGKVFSAECSQEIAESKGETEDARILSNSILIFKATDTMKNIDVENLESMIITSGKYLAGSEEMTGMKQMWKGISSPEMNIQDIKWFLNISSTNKVLELEMPLVDYMYYGFDINNLNSEYQIPIFYIQGSNDYITPTKLVEEYYSTINAPIKDIYIIEETGHTPFLDNPAKFAEYVQQAISNIK